MTQPPDGVDGPVERSARATAQRLADDYPAGLAADVEAALQAAGTSGRPERYLDPISLAALIVSAAQLAWTIYTDLKKKTAQPSTDVIARTVRVELPERTDIHPTDRTRVIAIVAEIVRQADEPVSG